MAHRSTIAVTWLKWLCSGMLVHLEVAHILRLRFLHSRLLLSPITIEVARLGSAMVLTTTTGKTAARVSSFIRLRELEACRTTTIACSSVANGHTLASPVRADTRAVASAKTGLCGLLGCTSRTDCATGRRW